MGSLRTEWLHFRFLLSCIGEGNGNPLQYSCLENPRDGNAWWAAVYGVAQSWTRLKRLSSSSSSSMKAEDLGDCGLRGAQCSRLVYKDSMKGAMSGGRSGVHMAQTLGSCWSISVLFWQQHGAIEGFKQGFDTVTVVQGESERYKTEWRVYSTGGFHAGRQRPRGVSRSGKSSCGAAGRHLLFHLPGLLVAIPWLVSTSAQREEGTGAESDLPSVLSEPPFWGMSSHFFFNCN